MRIDTSTWGTFRIGDIFTITRGKTLTSEDKEKYSGNIPCVNGASENNGVLCKLNEQIGILGKANLIKAPALSLSRVGNSGLTMFQAKDFYVADNSFGMKFIEVHTELCYMFISAILNLERFKYSYGRTIALSKYYDTRIKLPTYVDGTPDWDYMESYMKTLHYKPLTTKNKVGNALPLNVQEWKKFRVGDLFECKNGKMYELSSEQSPTSIQYYTSSENNNGFAGYINEYDEKDVIRVPSLTVGSRGNDAITYYHEGNYIANQNLTVLIPKQNISKFSMLFFAGVLRTEKYKYSYGRLMSKEKVRETILQLPATKEGTPDWNYMESYIKSLPYGDRI